MANQSIGNKENNNFNLKTSNGITITDSVKIDKKFREFYEKYMIQRYKIIWVHKMHFWIVWKFHKFQMAVEILEADLKKKKENK